MRRVAIIMVSIFILNQLSPFTLFVKEEQTAFAEELLDSNIVENNNVNKEGEQSKVVEDVLSNSNNEETVNVENNVVEVIPDNGTKNTSVEVDTSKAEYNELGIKIGTEVYGEDISKLSKEELQYIPEGWRDGVFENEHPAENQIQSRMSLRATYPDVNTYIQNLLPSIVEYNYKGFKQFEYRNGKGAVEGVVAHETANDHSTILQEINYMTNNWNNAFVHAFVDHERVIEIHPLDYGAWGAGRFANQRFVHVELLRVDNFDQFARSINNYAEYIANILYDYNLGVSSAESSGQGTLWSHKAVSIHLGGTNHVDPHGYFARYGYRWDQFVNLVTSKYNGIKKIEYLDTSKLGYLNSSNVRIYNNLENMNTYNTAGMEYVDKVYYIKKQAFYQSNLYYLISTQPSTTNGIIGWINAKDMSTNDHLWIDSREKNSYIKGTGKAYSNAWGGSKDIVYEDMTLYVNQEFLVNLTEKVGNNTWYQGELDGKLIWLHSSDITDFNPKIPKKSSTSRLGHLNSGATIYPNIEDRTSAVSADGYYDTVYYIKEQAEFNGEIYYLISTQPSATQGVVGWVKAKDSYSLNHQWLDSSSKTFYIKGTGRAYKKAWGGSKDVVYGDMTVYKDQEFKVNVTERVGNDTWYQGELNGRLIWLPPSDVTETGPTVPIIEKSSTSRLGHLNSGAMIYPNIEDPTSAVSADGKYDTVYYIKEQAEFNGEIYYLISTQPSATQGVVGWVKAKDSYSLNHQWLDSSSKTFYIKGTGRAYKKAWGGSKDVVYGDMTEFKDQELKVNLTEQVGNDTWYRGILFGNTIWVHSSHLK